MRLGKVDKTYVCLFRTKPVTTRPWLGAETSEPCCCLVLEVSSKTHECCDSVNSGVIMQCDDIRCFFERIRLAEGQLRVKWLISSGVKQSHNEILGYLRRFHMSPNREA